MLVGAIVERLKNLINEIAAQYGFEILAVEVMLDHTCTGSILALDASAGECRCMPLFVSASPKFSPAERMGYFKGIISGRLKQEFAYLRHPFCGGNATHWSEGYFVGTAGHVSAERIQ